MISEEEKYFVCLGMRTYGGSFVKQLGLALDSADHINRDKIKNAFPEYWKQYLKIGKKINDSKETVIKSHKCCSSCEDGLIY